MKAGHYLLMINIIYMGTPDYATVIFKKLYDNKEINIQAVFTQPDRAVGRKKVITPPHLKNYIIEHNINIPIFQPERLKDNKEIISIIKEYKSDFVVVAAYGQIVPKNILQLSYFINLHASILPKYRGASPIQDSILKDDDYTGVSAMAMDAGLDSGDIIALSYVDLSSKTIFIDELFELLSIKASILIEDVLLNFNTLQPYKQNRSLSTHCSKIKKEDALIEFKSAQDIYRSFRAYKFWPEIYIKSGLKFKDISIYDTTSINKQLTILSIKSDTIIVGCEVGSIAIKSVQPKSKKQMNIVDYIRGKRLQIGDTLS